MSSNNQRIRFLTVLLGTNGTGKTSFLKKMIKQLNEKGMRALIVTPDDLEYPRLRDYPLKDIKEFDFKNIRKHIYEPKHTYKTISENYKKGILILDDCREYLPANLENEPDFRSLLIRRRHKELDIFLVAHGFTDIPPKVFTFVNKYIIFKTTDDVVSRKDKIKDFEKVQAVVNRVNSMNLKTVSKFGNGRISYHEIIDV